MVFELDDSQTSRLRLMGAAKALIAARGYESTSTSSIARAAGTSESQLVRYFGGKAGLLEAILDACWAEVNPVLQQEVIVAPSGREALIKAMGTLVQAFEDDPDLAMIFLFEGKRIRGSGQDVLISDGFRRFTDLIRSLVTRSKADGNIRKDLDDEAVISALIGAGEGMMRDRLIATRAGQNALFSTEHIAEVFAAILRGMAPPDAWIRS